MERSDTLMDNHETGSFSDAFHQVAAAIETDVLRGRNVLLIASTIGEAHTMRDILRSKSAVLGIPNGKNSWLDFRSECEDESCHVMVLPAAMALAGFAPHPRFDTMYLCTAPEEKNDLLQLQARINRVKPEGYKGQELKYVVCVDCISVHNTPEFNERRQRKAERIAGYFNDVLPDCAVIMSVGKWF